MLQDTSPEELVTDSLQSLIAALGGGNQDTEPRPTRIIAEFDEPEDPPELQQRCRECVELFDALAFNRTLISLELRGYVPEEVCIAIAKALKRNATLQSFTFHNYDLATDNETGLAMANAIKANATLQSLAFKASDTAMDNETGLAIADAVKASATLQAFAFDARGTGMDNETGLAIAGAVKASTTLQSFAFHADFTVMTNETGLALADAVKASATLQSFTFSAYRTNMDSATGLALASVLRGNASVQEFAFHANGASAARETASAVARALLQNVTLLSCGISAPGFRPAKSLIEYAERNRQVRNQRHALTELARCRTSTGFQSLTDTVFRCKVLGYFLPPRCGWLPIEFARGTGAVHRAGPRK